MTFKFYTGKVIVENMIEYFVQGIILSFALFIIPSFRTIHNNMTINKFIYITIIISSMLVIIDRILPDISRSIRSFSGLTISTLSNPNIA